MTTPKLIDISQNVRCMGCGATGEPVVHVLGHSEVYARAWPLCGECLEREVARPLVDVPREVAYLDLPPEPADDEWLDIRTSR